MAAGAGVGLGAIPFNIRVRSNPMPSIGAEVIAGVIDDQLDMIGHIVDPTARLLAHMQLAQLPMTILTNLLIAAAPEPDKPEDMKDEDQQAAYLEAMAKHAAMRARLQQSIDRLRKTNLQMIDIMQQRFYEPHMPVGQRMVQENKQHFEQAGPHVLQRTLVETHGGQQQLLTQAQAQQQAQAQSQTRVPPIVVTVPTNVETTHATAMPVVLPLDHE